MASLKIASTTEKTTKPTKRIKPVKPKDKYRFHSDPLFPSREGDLTEEDREITLERLNREVHCPIPYGSSAKPKGPIFSLYLHANQFNGYGAVKDKLNRRHNLIVNYSIDGGIINEFVHVTVLGSGLASGSHIVRRADIVIERLPRPIED